MEDLISRDAEFFTIHQVIDWWEEGLGQFLLGDKPNGLMGLSLDIDKKKVVRRWVSESWKHDWHFVCLSRLGF